MKLHVLCLQGMQRLDRVGRCCHAQVGTAFPVCGCSSAWLGVGTEKLLPCSTFPSGEYHFSGFQWLPSLLPSFPRSLFAEHNVNAREEANIGRWSQKDQVSGRAWSAGLGSQYFRAKQWWLKITLLLEKEKCRTTHVGLRKIYLVKCTAS